MDDFTRKFNIATEKDAEIHQILSTVYRALEEKGYNPINQIVGYSPLCSPQAAAYYRRTAFSSAFSVSRMLFTSSSAS